MSGSELAMMGTATADGPLLLGIVQVSKINSIPVEDQPFETIMGLLKATPTPHALELRRYDYLRHIASGKWESFQELRAMVRGGKKLGLELYPNSEYKHQMDLTSPMCV